MHLLLINLKKQKTKNKTSKKDSQNNKTKTKMPFEIRRDKFENQTFMKNTPIYLNKVLWKLRQRKV